jgi:hypothetical protein
MHPIAAPASPLEARAAMTDLQPLDVSPGLSTTANALRRIILEAVPGAEERIYKGRTSAGYHDRQVGAFCGLFVTARAVRLEFPHGVRLAKPERILKAGRYVEFGPRARVPRAAVARVLHGAIVAAL